MKIIKCNGLSPRAMLARPDFRYVGRTIALRNGPNAGQVWPASPLQNPFHKFNCGDPIAEFRTLISDSAKTPKPWHSLAAALHALTDDLTLGCWCLNVEDIAIAPPGQERCHAEVIVNVWREIMGVSSK